MFDFVRMAKDLAKEKNIALNDFEISRITAIQRNVKNMTPEEIVKALSLEKKFFMALNREDWKKFEKAIKEAK